MKKTLTSMISGVLIACTLVGCGGPTGGGGGGSGSGGSLRIRAFDGGYGTEYLDEMGKAFSAINKGVKVIVQPSVDTPSDMAKIEAGTYVSDILVHTTNVNGRGMKGEYLNLDEIYAATPKGEDKTVAQKLGDNAQQFKNYDNHYYAMPLSDGMTGIVYNKTTLDLAFGEGEWELPKTTDEMYKMCQDLINKGDKQYYPFVFTSDTNAEYSIWLTYTYMTQLLGVEGYYEMTKGNYKDENGEYKFDADGELMYGCPEKIAAIEETQRFLAKDDKMVSEWCTSMDFAEAQAMFLGYGYGSRDKGKVAFMVNGDWTYNEMKYLITADHYQDVRMMKVPVSSEIVNYTDTISNDKELSALISAIDAGETALTGEGYDVSQEDFDKVAEARGVIYSLMTQQIATIPSNAKAVQLAKDFLVFLASDTGCELYSKSLSGDTSPYNHTPQQGVTPNTFIQSKLDILAKPYTYVMSLPRTEKFGVNPFANFYYYTLNCYNGELVTEYQSAQYKQIFLTAYTAAKQSAGLMG